MKLTLKLNDIKKIVKDHGLNKDGTAVMFLRDTIDRFCDPYIPWSGNGSGMKANKTYPNNHTIKYEGPYAHYHYKGILMLAASGSSYARLGESKHYTSKKMNYQGAPKRGPEWDKRMMNDRRKDVVKDVQNFIKRGGK